MPVFIQNKNGLVIDIKGGGTAKKTKLDSYAKKKSSPEWNNQLWECQLAIGNPGYCAFKNPASGLVINMPSSSMTPGGTLDIDTEEYQPGKIIATPVPQQIWTFVPQGTSGYYCIMSPIQVDSASGAGLVNLVIGANDDEGELLFLGFWDGKEEGTYAWRLLNEEGKVVSPPGDAVT